MALCRREGVGAGGRGVYETEFTEEAVRGGRIIESERVLAISIKPFTVIVSAGGSPR